MCIILIAYNYCTFCLVLIINISICYKWNNFYAIYKKKHTSNVLHNHNNLVRILILFNVI